MAVIVSAAFFDSGGLNAGTPLAMASTPVSATEPPANALSRSRIPSVSVPNGTASGSGGNWHDRPGHDAERPDGDDPEGQPDEQVGRDREDVPGLAQAAEVGDGDQPDRHERDLDPDVVCRREDRLDLGDRGSRRDGDGHDVVDQECRGGDEPEDRGEVRPGDDVRPAAVRIGATDLAVRDRDDRQEQRDRDRYLDRHEQGASAGDDQDPQDLLGRIGRRGDGVRAEDRERLLLREALLHLLLVRQRPPEDDGTEPGEGATASGPRDRCRLARDQLVRAGVAEVRGVRPIDADPPVARLSALERPPSADHDSISRRRQPGPAGAGAR